MANNAGEGAWHAPAFAVGFAIKLWVAKEQPAHLSVSVFRMPPTYSHRRLLTSARWITNDCANLLSFETWLVRVIDTDQKLAELLPCLGGTGWIALDTEADSLYSYPEKLCLLQLSVAGRDALVDPLASVQLDPLLEVLQPREIILHGCDYDLRLLWRAYRFVPAQVFDTMLAARYLGLSRYGLNDLAGEFLGIKLEKGPQKANWARRPLTDRMRDYALNDTRHLKALSDLLKEQLAAKGRLQWHADACAQLVQTCCRTKPADNHDIWRIKGSEKLSKGALGVLRELWYWRDHEAVQANKPPFFILSHELLVYLSEKATEGDLEPWLPKYLTPRRRAGLLEVVEQALTRPHPERVKHQRSSGRRMTHAEHREYEKLRIRRDACALALGLEASFIASRTTLLLLAQDWEEHQSRLLPWQRELLQPGLKPA